MSTPAERADTALAGFMMDFMNSIVTSGNTIQQQMQVDAQTSLNFGHMEQMLNQLYFSNAATTTHKAGGGAPGPGVNTADWNLQDWVEQTMADASSGSPSTSSQYVNADQAAYNKLSAQASGVTSFADTLTTGSNTMTSNDTTNFSQIMQLAQTLNLMGFIAQLLAKG